jgi:hypothetical protein
VMSRLHRARRMMQSSLIGYARDRGLAARAPQGSPSVVRLSDARDARQKK